MALAGTLAAILLIVTLADYRDRGAHHIILREDAGETLGFDLGHPLILEDGQVQLSWQPVAGAETFQVILFGHELDELVRLEDGDRTTLTFLPPAFSELPGSGAPILWRVAALCAGDEIALSPVQILRLP